MQEKPVKLNMNSETLTYCAVHSPQSPRPSCAQTGPASITSPNFCVPSVHFDRRSIHSSLLPFRLRPWGRARAAEQSRSLSLAALLVWLGLAMNAYGQNGSSLVGVTNVTGDYQILD